MGRTQGYVVLVDGSMFSSWLVHTDYDVESCCLYVEETLILGFCLFVFVTRGEKKTPLSKKSS